MKTIPFAILAAFMAVLLALYALPQPNAGAQGNTPCYGNQGGAEMVAGNGCTYTFEAGSRQKMQPNALTVTNGDVISNVYGVQQVSMTSAATATITTTGYVAGDTLIFYNASPSGTLTIADSDPVKASSAIALGQYDTASLWYDGTYWIQTGESDN